MKIHLQVFLLSIALTIPFFVIGQCPADENITFTSQAEVDQFIIDFPDCTKFDGNMRFIHSFSNFNGLSNIDTILGYLYFHDEPYVASLEGFENLKYVGDFISFDEPIGLLNFQGFNNLEYIGGALDMDEPSVFESTDGLNKLKFIGGNLNIYEADSLKTITGFPVLETVGGTISISENRYLEEINAFPVLTSAGSVYINDNDTLSTINLMDNLVTIDSFFEISWNRNLENLLGFSALTSINAEIEIVMNNKLSSLEGLENISPEAITNLIITESDSLSFCSVQSICDYLTMNLGPSEIGMNKSGCNTPTEITNICLGTTSAGVVYESNIEFFPNPASNIIQIRHDLRDVLNISITDINGSEISTYHPNSSEINVSNLSQGVYFLCIKAEDQNFYHKFIKL